MLPQWESREDTNLVGELGDLHGAETEVSKVVNLGGVGLDVTHGERPPREGEEAKEGTNSSSGKTLRVLVRVDGEAVLGSDDHRGLLLILSVEGTLLTVRLDALVYNT